MDERKFWNLVAFLVVLGALIGAVFAQAMVNHLGCDGERHEGYYPCQRDAHCLGGSESRQYLQQVYPGQQQQRQYQEPAPAPPLFRTASRLFLHIGQKPIVVLEPQYLGQNQYYDHLDFDGYYVIGFAYPGYGALGQAQILEEVAPAIQNGLVVKLSAYGQNVLQGATGADGYQLASWATERGAQKYETPEYGIEPSYAVAVKKSSVRFFDGQRLTGAAYQANVFTDSRRVRDWINLGAYALSQIQFLRSKVEMKLVTYLKVINPARQIIYTEKGAKEFAVSKTQFKQILGFGSASRDTIRGAEIAEELVKEMLPYKPTREQQVLTELRDELAETQAGAAYDEEVERLTEEIRKAREQRDAKANGKK